MGDTTKKMETEKKVEKKEEESAPVNFAELRDDLFREAAKLVSEDPNTRIAILVTAPPSEPDAAVYSFANPSVEDLLQKFLEEDNRHAPVPEDAEEEEDEEDDEEDEEGEGDTPPKRFWWDDLDYESMDEEQLREMMEITKDLLLQLKASERKGQGSGNDKDRLHDDKDAGHAPKP